jgi:precorrin isomerase
MTHLDRNSALRRGSCPGVYTPMESGDGMLVRVRTAARALSSADLRALASLAEAYGNGLLELTRRANVQLRGVRELAKVQAGLVAAGLASADPTRERRLAPLLVDPRLDAVPFCVALAACDYAPSAKFAIAIDAGALAEVDADLRVLVDGGLAYVAIGAHGLGACELERAPSVVAQLAGWISARAARARGLDLDLATLRREHDLCARPVPAGAPLPRGVALPFGAADARTFEALAALVPGVRVTPRRELLLQGDPDPRALRELGLLVDADDALRSVIACPGAPACGAAHGDTRTLARSLARTGQTLHVSGCEKGCAHSGRADVTLVRAREGVRLSFGGDVASAASQAVLSLEEARRQLASRSEATRLRPPMTRNYDYVRDGAEIYRRSFAIIRSEARLGRFDAVEERVAVRLVHTSGMVDLADDIVFTPGFAQAARDALRRGAPVLCDAKMIVSGVTRARLSAGNELLCFLDQPGLAALAKEQKNTRSAAALEYWKPRLDGALVAIGNAPTALFRLLELFDEIDARPAAVIGLPVGFVGAAESKDALIEDGRVPALIVRGRRGGSAMTVAAINALASDEE